MPARPAAPNYYDFSTYANGTPSYGALLSFNILYGELYLYLFNGAGQLLASSTTKNTDSQSLAFTGLIPANYQLEVYADGVSSAGVAYTLDIDPPAFVEPDALEGPNRNDYSTTATNLGLLSSPSPGTVVAYTNLTLDSTHITQTTDYNDVDWYRFQTTAQGAAGDSVTVGSNEFTAPVFLVLYDAYMNFEGISDSTEITAQGDYSNGFSLAGAPAGVYYVAAFTGPARGTASYSLNFVLPGPIPKDKYSSQSGGNATKATAAPLIPPSSTTDVQNGFEQYGASPNPLTIDTPGVGDWYQFQLAAEGTSADFVQINFNAVDGQLFMGLVNSSDDIVGLSANVGNTQEISLSLLPAGTYYLYVAGANGATNPDYLLSINAPAALVPDRFDLPYPGNNTKATATQLGTLQAQSTLSQLSIAPQGDVDWYEFSTAGASTSADYVGLDFDPSEGLIDAQLLDFSGDVIGRADDASYFTSDLGVEARMALPNEAGELTRITSSCTACKERRAPITRSITRCRALTARTIPWRARRAWAS